jgi:hypothetical protein
MQRRFLLVCVALLALPPAPAHAIRYELIDAAAGDQNGHTLSGFIEFDTPCGESCTAANIIDFSFAVTGPNEYSHSYQGPGDIVLFQPREAKFLNAGPRYLSLDFSRVGRLALFDEADNRNQPLILWDANITIFQDPISRYGSIMEQNVFTWVSPPRVAAPINIGVVVPEPSAFLSGLITAGLVLALRTPRQMKFAHPNLKD